ncbi:hypothetical protein CEP52_017190 [Fusarium oligoseptatum]|uniref:Uncharacterized protein n=1 Tax=Fusarium oligoseptatum TaxID=2604345 RepID=A0A428RVB0_9HYPO|nr:hypothetical protein CEP52_017190 [Fusarium oligoseptatum]
MDHKGSDAYTSRTLSTGSADAYGPRISKEYTGSDAYAPRTFNLGSPDAYGPRISMDYTTCSTNIIAPAVAMNIVTGFVVLLIVLVELSHLWKQRRNDNVNPTTPGLPPCSLWQFCHDVGESLDDEASINLGPLSRFRRQEEFMEDISPVFQKLFRV